MHKYEITATLWELELDDDGNELDRKMIKQDVVTSTNEHDRAQMLFDFLVKQ